jgi:hypothetical protein
MHNEELCNLHSSSDRPYYKKDEIKEWMAMHRVHEKLIQE